MSKRCSTTDLKFGALIALLLGIFVFLLWRFRSPHISDREIVNRLKWGMPLDEVRHLVGPLQTWDEFELVREASPSDMWDGGARYVFNFDRLWRLQNVVKQSWNRSGRVRAELLPVPWKP